MKSITSLKNIKGKRIMVRVDYNVPIKNGKVIDSFRIKKSLPTIKYLKDKGARVVLIAHLGREQDSLLPVYKKLNKFIKSNFINEIYSNKVKERISNMKDGDILLLENLRKDKKEEENNKNFAQELASLGDIYVNEAFSVSHRAHSSIVSLPKLLPSYGGFQLEEEVKNLSITFQNTKYPFLFILGGAKFETKMPLIKKYLKIADYVFIGGALANDFIKERGFNIGKSLTDEKNYNLKSLLKNKKLITLIDVLVKNGKKIKNKKLNEINDNDYILDIGELTIANLENYIKKSKLILWNGPLGLYEGGGDIASKKILKTISKTKAISIIGGGDTVSLISNLKLEKKLTFVSTGGGATLEFLSKGTLPGIRVLK